MIIWRGSLESIKLILAQPRQRRPYLAVASVVSQTPTHTMSSQLKAMPANSEALKFIGNIDRRILDCRTSVRSIRPILFRGRLLEHTVATEHLRHVAR